jgi:hypothetical protein
MRGLFSPILSLAVLVFASLASAAPTATSFVVVPENVELRQQRDTQSIQVLGTSADGFSVDLHTQAKYTIADTKIAEVTNDGIIRPLTNGQTQLTITALGQTKVVTVKVQLPTTERVLSFRHEVMPVLSKGGCNQGACHGYSLGKNGFKLSLRGQEADQDYAAIVRQAGGRRMNFLSPESSLLVAKSRGESTHEGGARFSRDSYCDAILTKWIQQGAPSDIGKDKAEVVAVRVVPDKVVLQSGQTQRIQLIAEYDDGTKRDVTRLGIFAANNTQFAKVTDDGLLTAGDLGETAIVARYERTFAAVSVTVLKPQPAFTATPVPAHLVDKHVIEKLNRIKVTPSPLASDEVFLRRLYLDVIGVQPKPDEIRAFLADKDAAKREKVIDTLFTRPEFVDQWSLKWGDLLQNSRNSVSSPSVYQFREFIRAAIAENTPMDIFARKLLTAKGGISEDPASVYYSISKDTNDTVERVTQVFCGVRMLCARCHAHPMENWTQADYYGVATFFNQVSLRADGRYPNQPNTKLVVLNRNAGAAMNPRTGQPQAAKFLGGVAPKLDAKQDRREAYATWLTAPENPFFARGLVNRVWSYFFHRGIIDPVDDIRNTNPPINPALLDALTKDFIEHKFDVRHLMKRIATSATYQRSSIPTDGNRHDEQNFSHAIPRRVPAEAVLDSLVQATGIPENFGGAPGGFRAAQLPDGNVENAILKLFGKPQRMDACECERDNGSNMLQALHFMNSKGTLGRVQNAAARPAQLTKQKISEEALVQEIYLWTLARFPNEKELKLGIEFIQTADKDRLIGTQDLMWALLNSKDFLLVH